MPRVCTAHSLHYKLTLLGFMVCGLVWVLVPREPPLSDLITSWFACKILEQPQFESTSTCICEMCIEVSEAWRSFQFIIIGNAELQYLCLRETNKVFDSTTDIYFFCRFFNFDTEFVLMKETIHSFFWVFFIFLYLVTPEWTTLALLSHL